MSTLSSLKEFIKSSPTPFHTVSTIKNILLAAGYTEVSERDSAAYSDGGRHFAVKNDSSIIAFRGSTDNGGFMITAAHSDTPAFKVKESTASGAYAKLLTERYGGMILYSWLDRPLSIAGRVMLRTKDGVKSALVNIDRDVAVIPSVAIHMNRTVNEGYKFNPAIDMLPLVSLGTKTVAELIAPTLDTTPDSILTHDLFLYNRDESRTVGMGGEFILSPRLDDLACVYSALTAFLAASETDRSVSVLAVFDNEEIGSDTKQGAASTFLADTLRHIAASDARYAAMLADSFIVSADNAHAKHPNHPELSDSLNAPVLGGGSVIKYNANQKYATDAISDAIFRLAAERAGQTVQSYSNRADLPGGSTLGSIADTRVSVVTVDVGIPQLAMHSASELVALSDLDNMIAILTELYSSGISMADSEIRLVK